MQSIVGAEGRRRVRWVSILISVAVVVAACSDGGDRGTGADGAGGGDAGGTTPTTAPCRVDDLGGESELFVTGSDPVAVSAAVAERTHRCSEAVVVASSDDAWGAAIASAVALGHDAPLLLIDPADPLRTAGAVARLDPAEVVGVGVDATAVVPSGAVLTAVATTGAAPGPSSTSTTDPSTSTALNRADDAPAGPAGTDPVERPGVADPALALAVVAADHLDAAQLVAVPAGDADARAAAAGRLQPGQALLPLPADLAGLDTLAGRLPPEAAATVVATDPAVATSAATALTAAGVPATAEVGPRWPDGQAPAVWLVDPAQGPAAAVAATAAVGRGERLLPVTASDLRAGRERTGRVRAADPDRAVLVGDVTADADWQLPLIRSGPELPGGGFRLFDGARMVALYGHPAHGSLGALGEQDLDASVDRARRAAAPYGADGARVLPAFEIIATVASAEAGDLGDYSRRTAIDLLRPYVDRAAVEGLYVVLDLQPGRTDFLTQARDYEELLLEPHVGLALDPEWRLLPHQVHLRQVGSVAAAEVQSVVDWLAELTRRNELPEKLLVLHQFRHSMLPDRDTITDPPELAMVVHMDGQGPIPSKDGTYRSLTAGAEDRWLWGWKNFYDEDQPTPSPDHVLALDPRPVFVTYQ